MLSCIIIEDQAPAQRILKKYIHSTEHLELKNTFTDAVKALSYLKNETVDIIFLDINLPKMSGMDFLRSLEVKSYVILTTAFSEYALESYEYGVVDYLLKPFSFERFDKSIKKIVQLHRSNSQEENITDAYIYIKSGYELTKIDRNDIIFIKSDGDYTEIVTPKRTYLSNDSLKYWTQVLDASFQQIHKSYVANTIYIEKISGNKIHLNSEYVLPIGRSFKKDFIESL